MTTTREDELVEHDLKVWPDFFEDIASGRKLFEVRLNDRGYKVGDRLRLREYAPGPDEYTGREHRDEIAYLISDTDIPFGAAALKLGYCVIGLAGAAARPIIEREEREKAAKIADEYSDWTYWGQDNNAVAAQSASREIAEAIRKGRWLTTDEIKEVDAKHRRDLTSNKEW